MRAREESREPKFHHTYSSTRLYLCHTHSQLCVGVCVCVVTLAVNAQLLSLACATFVSGNADLRNVGLGISHLDQTA